MTEWLLQLPTWMAFAAIAGVGIVRGIGYYVSGAWLRGRAGRSSRAGHQPRPAVARAEATVRRVGAPAVTAAYFVYGLSAATIITAGAIRMPFGRFLIALAVGALAWAAFLTLAATALLRAIQEGSWMWAVGLTVGGILAAVTARTVARRLRVA